MLVVEKLPTSVNVHLGHSRTIIGYEQFRNGNIRLLMFDPGTPKPQIDEFRADPNDKAHIFRRSLQSFQKPVYQILLVRGLLRPEEREVRPTGGHERVFPRRPFLL